MEKLITLFREDVNQNDSAIIKQMGSFTESIFNGIKWFGIPFFIFIFIQLIAG
ncbi:MULTISPECIES: hypothetical protein [unclassified Bacillus (in: firmicutes)]|uniref:hypothetical protein n=1 Tax=unclassified Bacillus (in: firmicutes) TaxID=185979 RepID=UPI0008F24EB9|nr:MULTISPECIES: hypothetical protein [unclassified Bacillus (in: firmicutes)]SFA92033.1 hypothetical protein SAMN02799634_102626 [Bacillus sp. UNCCL13]SFQ85762.1 hypothetical protein SAMN04488577_2744 [Bacillus sp. cl95]